MSSEAAPVALHVFPTFVVGGSQARFVALARHFGTAYRHIVVAMDGRTDCAARLPAELKVVYPELVVRKGATLRNAARFRQVLRDLRPDVLVTYNWGSIEWAVANMAPPIARHVHIEDGFGPEERHAQIRRRVLMRRLFLRRSVVVLPSLTLWRIATAIWRLPSERLRYVPNGVDLARFSAAPPPGDGAGWPAAGPVIGTVAALREEKNLGRLIRAFARLERPCRLVIVGDGPARAGLEVLTQELSLAARVHFAGQIEDPAPLFGEFDLFALSSDTEQMPLSVLEAMAAGLPVAATDVGDVRQMLAAENRDFVTPRNEEALADAMQALLARPASSRRIGAANRRKAVGEYDQAIMFRAYRALFDGREPAGAPQPPC